MVSAPVSAISASATGPMLPRAVESKVEQTLKYSCCAPCESNQRPAATVAQHHHMPRPVAGTPDILFVRQADIDPAFNGASQVGIEQIRLVLGGQATAKSQAIRRVQGKRQQAHHHPFIGLRRMAGNRQRVIAKVRTIEVGQLQFRLEDG